MNKFWLICSYEYLRHVKRKRFIFALLSMPLMIVFMIGAGFLAVWAEYDARPVGYVDALNVFANPQPVPAVPDEWLPDPEIRRYPDESAARSALDGNQIQGYYVLQPDYLKDGSAKYTTTGKAKDSTESAFRSFLRYNLAASQPPEVAKRLVKGPDLEIRSLGGSRKMGENDFLSILFPMIIGVLFLLVINTSGSYLVGALVEEKENRTMEIVVTSVSTNQMMAGKVVGNLAVGITELMVWIGFGLITLAFMRANLGEAAKALNLDAGYLWLSFFTLVPAFVMVAGLMATAGVTMTDTREAQQVAGLFTLPVVVPFWLIMPLMESPNSPLSVGLSLFPLTAPISMAVRAAFTDVPAWQIAICIGLLVICAFGALWMAGRAFRMGMLRYGKRLTWREIFGKA
jgi:ABC-2 type transport system permease protein